MFSCVLFPAIGEEIQANSNDAKGKSRSSAKMAGKSPKKKVTINRRLNRLLLGRKEK
jgi:hypothetical protein